MQGVITFLAVALAFGVSASSARATSLDFIGDPSPNSTDEACIEGGLPNCYGDHVSASPNSNGSTIGMGYAFTPNIGVAYSGNLRTWASPNFGFLASGNNVNPGFFSLIPDPGYRLGLKSVTLDTDGIAGTHFVYVLVGPPGGQLIGWFTFSGSDPITYEVNTLTGELTFVMQSSHVGISNVNFSQLSGIANPLPPALVFFLTGLGGLGLIARRK